MDAATSISADSTREIPTGPTVSEMMKEFYRASDIIPPTAQEIGSLPSWTEQEAAAFERTINEAFEQVEDAPGQP